MSRSCYTIAEIAELLNVEFSGDAKLCLKGIATLDSAGADQLSFFHNPKYTADLSRSSAGAVLVKAEYADQVQGIALIVADPYLAYARCTALFSGAVEFERAVHVSASIADTAEINPTAQLGPNVVVGSNTLITKNVVIEANTVIGNDCIVGEGSLISANVTLYSNVKLGLRCRIHSGAVLGADGFGFANERGQWIKIHQLGGVTIGDDVEVGAGTTIDRGALDDTVIGNGVILDNQIQIAHNVVIGENTAIAGCTAVAGSTRIGKNCTIAGACGITGHLNIADGTHVTAMSLVSKSISKAGAYSSGTVAEPHHQWKKNVVRFRQLDDICRRIKKLESIVKQQNTKGQSE